MIVGATLGSLLWSVDGSSSRVHWPRGIVALMVACCIGIVVLVMLHW